jgi:hypothetical protein
MRVGTARLVAVALLAALGTGCSAPVRAPAARGSAAGAAPRLSVVADALSVEQDGLYTAAVGRPSRAGTLAAFAALSDAAASVVLADPSPWPRRPADVDEVDTVLPTAPVVAASVVRRNGVPATGLRRLLAHLDVVPSERTVRSSGSAACRSVESRLRRGRPPSLAQLAAVGPGGCRFAAGVEGPRSWPLVARADETGAESIRWVASVRLDDRTECAACDRFLAAVEADLVRAAREATPTTVTVSADVAWSLRLLLGNGDSGPASEVLDQAARRAFRWAGRLQTHVSTDPMLLVWTRGLLSPDERRLLAPALAKAGAGGTGPAEGDVDHLVALVARGASRAAVADAVDDVAPTQDPRELARLAGASLYAGACPSSVRTAQPPDADGDPVTAYYAALVARAREACAGTAQRTPEHGRAGAAALTVNLGGSSAPSGEVVEAWLRAETACLSGWVPTVRLTGDGAGRAAADDPGSFDVGREYAAHRLRQIAAGRCSGGWWDPAAGR